MATVGPVRVHRAKLTFATWRPSARVTIEVEPWSRTESELLVRPTRPPRGEDAYFATALAVLEALAFEIGASLTLVSENVPDEVLRRAS